MTDESPKLPQDLYLSRENFNWHAAMMIAVTALKFNIGVMMVIQKTIIKFQQFSERDNKLDGKHNKRLSHSADL